MKEKNVYPPSATVKVIDKVVVSAVMSSVAV